MPTAGVAWIAFGAFVIATDSVSFGALMCVSGVLLLADGVRARVEVDVGRSSVTVTRSLLRTTIPLASVERVFIPRLGAVRLVVRPGVVPWYRGDIWPNVVNTGLHPGPNGQIAEQISALVARPLRSYRRSIQPGVERAPIRPWWVATFGTIALAICVVLIVATR
jgi:hypothetical protein